MVSFIKMKNPHTPHHQRWKSGIWWPVLSCGEGHLKIRITKTRTSCCVVSFQNPIMLLCLWFGRWDMGTHEKYTYVTDSAGQGKFLFLWKIEPARHPFAHLQPLQLKSALWGKVIGYRPARAELLEKSNWCGEHSRQKSELEIYWWAGSFWVSYYVWRW